MPKVEVIFYRTDDGAAPALDWLNQVRRREPRAFAKCLVRLRRLALMGHELRRPEADTLRDGVHELRVRFGTVNYRLLYFFSGQTVCVVAHALTKDDEVPEADIDTAVARLHAFAADPEGHTYHAEDST